MIQGRVIGAVWAARRAPGLDGRELRLVALPGGRVVVAADPLGARPGSAVLVAFGSGARNAVQPAPSGDHNRHLLCDAAVALIVDGEPACSSDA